MLKLRYKKNLNSNLITKFLNFSKLQSFLSKIFDFNYMKSDYKKLNLINLAYYIKIKNRLSIISVILIIVKSYTSLEIYIYYKIFRFYVIDSTQ